MESFAEQISQVQSLMKEIQKDKDFIAREKASYEERIAVPNERIKSNKYLCDEITTKDVFVCLKDVVAEVAKEWECPIQNLSVQFRRDVPFANDISDEQMRKLTPYYSAGDFLLQIRDNRYSFRTRVSVNKTDIQLDGKSFEDHIIAKPYANGKFCSVDDYSNVIFRVRLEKVVEVSEDKVEYQGGVGNILARAILRKEERERKSQISNDEGENEAE